MEFLLRTSAMVDGERGFDPKTLEWYYLSEGVFDTGTASSINEIFDIFKSN